MIRLALPLALLLLAGPAEAARRDYAITSFDRVRVTGPFEVRVIAGTSPRASAKGEEAALDQVVVEQLGTTLVVRPGGGTWDTAPRRSAASTTVVTLVGPPVTGASINGGARLAIDKAAGERVDLAVAGAGTLAVADARTAALTAQIIGAGAITLAGKVDRARLSVNGPGGIDASALDAGDLVVTVEGPGDTRAAARYNAQVTNNGAGSVVVTGSPKCAVKTGAGPVTCGDVRR